MNSKPTNLLYVMVPFTCLSDAFGCDMVLPRQLIPPEVGSETPTETVQPPQEIHVTVSRGDAEHSNSCSELGMITFRIRPAEWIDLPEMQRPLEVGYRFEVIDRTIDKNMYFVGFSSDAVSPVSQSDGYHLFAFAWVDGISLEQEPMKLSLDIYAENRWGVRSSPVRVTIEDPGHGVRVTR